MPNGIGDWDEWNSLTEDQQKYSLYKILKSMETRLSHCPDQLDRCDRRFVKIERRKWFDRGVAVVTGVITGIAAALGVKL